MLSKVTFVQIWIINLPKSWTSHKNLMCPIQDRFLRDHLDCPEVQFNHLSCATWVLLRLEWSLASDAVHLGWIVWLLYAKWILFCGDVLLSKCLLAYLLFIVFTFVILFFCSGTKFCWLKAWSSLFGLYRDKIRYLFSNAVKVKWDRLPGMMFCRTPSFGVKLSLKMWLYLSQWNLDSWIH